MKSLVKLHARWLSLLMVTAMMAFGILPWLCGSAQRVEQGNDRLARELKAAGRAGGMTAAALDNDEARRLLLPTDRSAMTEEIKRYAVSARLSHLSVALAPPRKPDSWLGADDNLVAGDLTLTADAGLDVDVVAFLDHLPALLPGGVRLKRVTMKREVFEGQSSLDGLHVEAVYEWLTNKAGSGL